MKTNMGSYDRIIRLILGAAIIAAGIYFQSYWGLIGLVLALTALVSNCPAYTVFGISTKRFGANTPHKHAHS